jgi:hypothetical protein
MNEQFAVVERNVRPALVSTVHDPGGKLMSALAARRSALAWYDAVYVSVTDQTDPSLCDVLRAAGVTVEARPAGQAGVGRTHCLAMGVARGHDAYLYCDFDRWLHWVARFPEELSGLPSRIARRRPRPWYVAIGRTARAFATHPEVQRVAEGATIRALELAIGRRIDATAGACWIAPPAARIIVEQSRETTMGTDLEWPALVWRVDPRRLGAVRVEGLEFESAAFAGEAIAAAGSEAAWIASVYQRPAMWQARLQLAADSIEALRRVANATE